VTTQTDAAIIDIDGDETTPSRRVMGAYRDYQKKLLTLCQGRRRTEPLSAF
jgi:hypothetical protein